MFSSAPTSGMYKCALRITPTRYLHPLFTRTFQPFPIARFSTRIRMSPMKQFDIMENPHLANVHISVDPEGNRVFDLNFISEALGMPAANGYGWPQLEFGDKIGEDGRYTIVRKLGWGGHSSTWLARDSMLVYCQLPHYFDELTPRFHSDNKFVAVKVLTGHFTGMYERALVWEPEALRIVSYQPTSPHCTLLLDEFTIPGKGSAGSHMCFVMPVYGGDVKALIEAQTTALPLPLAKRIALHLLRGIVHAHERKVVHTDIKLDNIFFSTAMTTDDIEAWLTKNPSRRHAPEASFDGEVQAAVSQPLPMISEDETMRATHLLADFGCGMYSRRTFFDPSVHNGFQRSTRTSIPTGQWQLPSCDHRRHTLRRNGTSPRTFGLSVA